MFDDRKESKCVRPPLETLLITWNWSQVLRHRQFRETVDPQILHKIANWYSTIERKANAVGHPWRPSQSHGIGPRSWDKRQFRENVDPQILHKIPNWYVTIERNANAFGHPWRPSQSHGIGPRPWDIASFEKTLTLKFCIKFQTIERKANALGHPWRPS